MKLRIYLAGAIRDDHPEDIEWREQMIDELADAADFLNPLAGKRYDLTGRRWYMGGLEPTAKMVVHHDFHAIDRADAIVFNFRALSEGYPNIGTLVEFGRATARRCLTYSIVAPDYAGHENPGALWRLHPFLEENSSLVFPSVDACIDFLKIQLPAITGDHPRFGGFSGEFRE